MAVKFKDTININGQYTLPLTDGTDGQVLVTDGAGNLTFSSELIAGSAESAESTHLNVKNTSGASIAKGTPVYVTGSVGNTDKLEIAPADASNASHMPAIGLLESTLANNGEGFVVQGGLLKGLVTDTIDGSASTANDTVYVKAGGGLTLTKPTGSTNFIQNIAKVARVHNGNGSLIVSSILRTNDVPNLSTGKIWVGDSNTIESTVVHIDETNGRLGIGTDSPDVALHSFGTGDVAKFETTSFGGVNFSRENPVGNHSTHFVTSFNNSDSEVAYIKTLNKTGATTSTGTGYELQIAAAGTGYQTFYTNGSERMRIDSNGDTTFTGNLTVGDGHFIGDDSFDNLLLQAGGTGNLENLVLSASNDLIFYTGGSSPNSYGTQRLRIFNSDGRAYFTNSVGIGTDSPSNDTSGLHIAVNSSTDQLYLERTGSGTGKFYLGTGANSFIIVDAAQSAERLRINSSGNVGIGTTSPTTSYNRALHINDPANSSAELHITAGSGTTASDGLSIIQSGVTSFVYNREAGNMIFGTSNTERMRIDSSGRVGINETNPSTAKLVIQTDAGSGIDLYRSATNANFEAFRFRDSTNANTEASIGWSSNQLRLNSTNNTVFTTGGTERLRIDSSGVSKFIPTKAYGDTSSSLKIFGAFTGTNYSDGSYYNLTFGDDDVTNGYLGSITVKQLNASASTATEMLFYTNAGGGNGGINPRMVIDEVGNVGIGTTNPSNTTHIYKNATIGAITSTTTANAGLRIQDSGANMYFDGNSIILDNTGYLTTNGAYDFVLGTNNTTRIHIDSGGNIGIGTTSPSSILHLESASSPVLTIKDTTNNVKLLVYSQDSDSHIGTYSNHPLVFDTNSAEAMRIDSSGNVGIGTTAPQTKLHITDAITISNVGSTNDTTLIQFTETTNYDEFAIKGDFAGAGGENKLKFTTDLGGGDILVMKGDGNVGIGTTSPSHKLHVSGNSFIDATSASAALVLGRYTGQPNLKAGTDDSGYMIIESSGGKAALNWFSGDDVILALGGGNVGIGTTSPSHKLEVSAKGSQLGSSGYYINSIFNDTDNNVGVFTAHNDTSNGVGAIAGINELAFITYGTSWGERMRIDSSGNVGIGVVTPGSKLHIGGAPDSKVITIDQGGRQSAIGTYFSSNTSDSRIDFFISDGNTNGGSNNRMSIKGNGNVGIGTTNPSQKLTVSGNAYIAGGLLLLDDNQPIQWGNSQQKIKGNNNGYLQFITGNSEKMRIDSSGNVGIGTSPYASTLGTFTSIDLGLSASMWGYFNSVYLNSNAYFNNGWLYKNTDSAGVLQVDGNVLTFRHATSGTANTAIGLSEAFRISSSGNVTANVDMRAPIFYDSDNTGYYVDPSGASSLLNYLYIGEAAYSTSTGYVGLKTEHMSGANDYMMISGKADGNTYISGKDGSGVYVRGGGNSTSNQIYIPDGNTITATTSSFQVTGDARAPIFYDSDDTGYYVNPNNVTNLNAVHTTRIGVNLSASSSNRYGISLYGGYSAGEPTYGLLFTGTSLGTHGSVTGDWATYFTMNNSANRGWIFRNITTGNVASINNAGTAHFNGDVVASGSSRAQVFYDSDDTNYYIDPNNTTTAGFIRGKLLIGTNNTWGKTIQVGGNGREYINNTNVASVVTTNGNLHLDSASSSQTYINFYDGDRVNFGDGGGSAIVGAIHSDGSARFPIFYDYDNTSFFVNPASTSEFNQIDARYFDVEANAAYALRFWGGSHNYSIRMSQSSDNTYGGRVAGETTSDYNMYFTMSAGTNRGFVFRSSNSSSSAVAGIDASGNGRFNGDVVASCSSDERLKDNKKNIDNALEKVESLNGVEFDWNDKQDVYEGHDIGVIAQEVEKVLPEIVNTRDNGYKAVKYEKLVPLLIEAIKELSNEIKELKNK